MTVKKFLLYGIVFIILSILGIYSYVHIAIIDELPSFEQLENPPQELATRVLSNDGEVLDMFYIKRRTYIPYDSIPKNIINALISTEDREYFNHVFCLMIWHCNITSVILNQLLFSMMDYVYSLHPRTSF